MTSKQSDKSIGYDIPKITYLGCKLRGLKTLNSLKKECQNKSLQEEGGGKANELQLRK